MTVDFRSMARSHLSDVREALEQHSPSTLRSAALSLRMSMEAFTYERAKLYADDLSAEEYETWQPRKLMRILLEIDPHADTTCGLSYGIKPSLGETPEKMTFLGTENVLNLNPAWMAPARQSKEAVSPESAKSSVRYRKDG